MNADLLLAHYEKIADAEDAIPRLRRFILNLAVRGKLVPQDPADEPASELLKRIEAEKVGMDDRGESKKVNLSNPFADAGTPFALPIGWAWSTVGQICSKTGSGSTPRGGKNAYTEEGIYFLRSQNIHNDGLRLDDIVYIDSATHERMSGTAVRPRDLLLNITGGSIGRCCRIPDQFGQANVSQHVSIVRPAIDGIHEFLHNLILSPYFQSFIFDEQTGAGRGGLPKKKMDRIPVAFPPLAEQHRIVAKVDELMALCDRLEAAREKREATRTRLTAASLAHLNAPDPDVKTFRKHATRTLETLAPLTARPNQIKLLRQTILNLAVRGKLVPQNAGDESVDALLEDVKQRQQELSKNGRLKKVALDSLINEEDDLPALPSSWRWVPLGRLISFGPQNGLSPRPTSASNAPRSVTLTATTSGQFDNSKFKHVEADVPPNSEFWLRKGDLLFQRGNTREYVGMAAYYDGADGEFLYPDLMIKVRVFDCLCLDYIHLAVISPDTRNYFSESASGAQKTMPKISQGILLSTPVPLPPLVEQCRIVAKVDELMALCDRLEASLERSVATRTRLLDALLHAALSGETPDTEEPELLEATA